jgi:hypothetical protein
MFTAKVPEVCTAAAPVLAGLVQADQDHRLHGQRGHGTRSGAVLLALCRRGDDREIAGEASNHVTEDAVIDDLGVAEPAQ